MSNLQTISDIKKIVFKHIDSEMYKVFLFGSRASGNPKTWSDFDVGVMGPQQLPIRVKTDIEDELEASSIPYIVELVDFQSVDSNFKDHALKDAVLWN